MYIIDSLCSRLDLPFVHTNVIILFAKPENFPSDNHWTIYQTKNLDLNVAAYVRQSCFN